jgi:hypothetical protein
MCESKLTDDHLSLLSPKAQHQVKDELNHLFCGATTWFVGTVQKGTWFSLVPISLRQSQPTILKWIYRRNFVGSLKHSP